MKYLRIYFVSMISVFILSLLWLPNTSAADQGIKDNNNNGIDDNWERRYNLKPGKEIASEDPDKDGLNNFFEYQLNLSPISNDTNKNKVPDGLENFDNDGLYNLAEVKMGLNPKVPDKDKSKIIHVSDLIDHPLDKNNRDMTEQIQQALKLGAGKMVVLPYGSSFKVSGLRIPDNTAVVGYGSKIYNNNKHQTLLTIGSGVKLYGIELQGAGNKKADSKGIGIKIQGAGAAGYAKNIIIEDVSIYNIGFYGIFAEFADRVKISNTLIRDIGFAGVGGLSVKNMHIDSSHIKGISPGNKGNAYGVFYSRKGAESSLKAHPRSADSSVTNSIIEDIPLWEALDTHGGENISFSNNTIRNAKVGIAFVNATGRGGKELFGSQKCKAKGNKIAGIGKGYGIVLAGSSSDNSRGCTIEGNQLTKAGQQGNSISGAIQASYTRDLVIKDNILVNSYANGIHLYTHNQQFTISGNKVEDVQDNVYKVPSAIAFRSGNNSGTIAGNTLLRKNEKLNAYVSLRGINISTQERMELVIGKNSNNFVLPVAGGAGKHVKYKLK
ncbi:right-handed parallel beta-helix repeat-containing protein [Cytobacillus pseudoceanisediminis]|uniref:right-handed parallel beta-helix repeat-containing protein n=1 Tax=Cytobacillus pseudoceanisediminis TaxID=3051614 RepID=UPI003C2C970B